MFNEFAKKVELKFWDVAIPIMIKTSWMKKTMKTNPSSVYQPDERTKNIILLIGAICGGFAFGFLFFSIKSLF